jgi:hypothetical protein
MSLQNVSNHKQLLIGKNAATNPTAGQVASPSTLADGAIALTTMDGVILSSTTADDVASTTPVVLVQGQGANKPLIKSAPFTRSSLLLTKAKKYAPAAQQVSYVGYVSATTGLGSIELPGAGTSVILRNTFKTNFFQFSDKLMESIVGYKVTASDTTSSLVDYLVKYAIQDVQRYVNIPYAVERVNSSTTEAAGAGGATNIIFTKGSSQVTWTGAITNLPVGTYFRLATGVTNAIYKVKEKNATNLVLDTPYQGSTNTVAAVATLQVVTPVTTSGTAGAGWGIRFTGYPQTKFAPNIFRYETSKFVTTATNFGATTVSNAYVVPTEGSGVYEQIAEEEFFFQLFEGMHDANLIQVPPVTMRSNVELTGYYSIIDLEVATQSGTMSFINNPIARKQIRLAVNGGSITGGTPAGSSSTSAELTYIAAVLDAFITATTTSTPLTTQLT